MGISWKIFYHLSLLGCIVGSALSNPFDSNHDNSKDENVHKGTRVVEMIPLASENIKIVEDVIRQQSRDIKADNSVPPTQDGFDETVPEIDFDSGALPRHEVELNAEVSKIQNNFETEATKTKLQEEFMSKFPENQIGTNGLNIKILPTTNLEDRTMYGRDVETKPEETPSINEKATNDHVSFINESKDTSEPSTVTETPELPSNASDDDKKSIALQSERQQFDYYGDYSSAGSIADYGIDNDLYNYGSNYDTGNTYDNYDIGNLDYGVEADNYNTGDLDYGIDNYNQGDGDYGIDNYNLGESYDVGSEYSNFDDYGDYLLKTQRELENQIDATQREIESLISQL